MTQQLEKPTPAARQFPSLATGLLTRLSAVTITGIFLIVVVAAFAFTANGFLTVNNASTVLSSMTVLMVTALGQLLVVISGGFDLSIGGMLPLAAVMFASLTHSGWPVPAAIAICLLVGTVLGIVHSVFIVGFKINPLITTLATMSVTGGIAFIVAKGQTLSVSAMAGVLGNNVVGTIPWSVFLMIALIIAVYLLLQHTVIGRRIYMVGGNIEAAGIAGVRVGLIGGIAYSLSGVFAALAGVILASQLLAASGTIGAQITLQSLTAVVLGGAALTGGRGTVVGAVIGVFLLGVIENGMTILLVPSFYQQVVSGLVLLAAVSLSRLQERTRRGR